MENLTEHIDAIEKERNEFALELARSVIERREDARAADIEQTGMREQMIVGRLADVEALRRDLRVATFERAEFRQEADNQRECANKYWRDAEATQGLLDRERAALNATIELLHRTEAERNLAQEDFDAAEKRLSSERLELSVMRERNSILEAGANKLARELEAVTAAVQKSRAKVEALTIKARDVDKFRSERDALAMLIDMRARYTYLGTKGLMSSQTITVLLSTGDTVLSAVLEAAEGATSMSDEELRMRIDLRKSGPFWHMDQQTRSDLLKRFARTE